MGFKTESALKHSLCLFLFLHLLWFLYSWIYLVWFWTIKKYILSNEILGARDRQDLSFLVFILLYLTENCESTDRKAPSVSSLWSHPTCVDQGSTFSVFIRGFYIWYPLCAKQDKGSGNQNEREVGIHFQL
jgi:hypothetical protein